MELCTLQDWVVRREMLGTTGVADINSYGGFVKQYEIAVNPERLRGMKLSLTDIFGALEKNNENTGSATRYGAFVVDTAEAVGGVVMMLKGANAHDPQILTSKHQALLVISSNLELLLYELRQFFDN